MGTTLSDFSQRIDKNGKIIHTFLGKSYEVGLSKAKPNDNRSRHSKNVGLRFTQPNLPGFSVNRMKSFSTRSRCGTAQKPFTLASRLPASSCFQLKRLRRTVFHITPYAKLAVLLGAEEFALIAKVSEEITVATIIKPIFLQLHLKYLKFH